MAKKQTILLFLVFKEKTTYFYKNLKLYCLHIQPVTSLTFFEMIFDQKLTWKYHIRKVVLSLLQSDLLKL